MNTTIDDLYPDIWEYIFAYFNVNELLFSFQNITQASNEALFNRNNPFLFRELILDAFVSTLPVHIRLGQVSSLKYHQENFLDIIQKCTYLRSLELIGTSEWVISTLVKVSNAQIKIQKLRLILPDIGSLDRIFNSIGSISSLLRFEIYANESEEKMQMNNLAIDQTNIQHFTLHSSSFIRWNDMSSMLPALLNINSLDITLFEKNKANVFPFNFPKLTYVRLLMHELSFETLFELVATTPALRKLKINGLIDDRDFFIGNKWIYLFSICSLLNVIIVNLSISESTNFFYEGINRIALNQINLNLECLDNDDDDYSIERYQQRWWKLSGMIMKSRFLLLC